MQVKVLRLLAYFFFLAIFLAAFLVGLPAGRDCFLAAHCLQSVMTFTGAGAGFGASTGLAGSVLAAHSL